MTDFFSKLFEVLFGWIPRFSIIQPDEAGIKLSCGKYICDLEPGLYWYWPLISSIKTTPVKTQEINLDNQLIDGIGISGVIWYIIFNVHDALLNVHDYDEAVPNAAMGIVALHVNEPLLELCELVKNELNELSEEWGIKVTRVTITDRSPCIGVKVM